MIGPTERRWFAIALARALRFYSTLPVPRLPDEARLEGKLDFASMAIAVPLAGAVIGAVPALAFLAAHALHLGTAAAVIAALSCGLLVTGALHEDGIADVADGFFGAETIERRLEIMRDSRHGSFGVLALILVMLGRYALLTEIAAGRTSAAAAALIAAAALSRAACLMPLSLLPPARRDGAGAAASGLPFQAFARGSMIGCALTLVLALIGGFGALRGVLACIAALAACYGVCALAKARIGGQTGDVAGAAQILAELAVYLALAMGLV
jgi:adenosylcobinamide-GDP ribazoletransferase